MESVDTPQADKVANFLAGAAVWAPSVYDTRPWWFGTRGSTVTVHALADRRLEIADPDGRQMMISCGAALYALRLAVCNAGRRPEVRTLPDPDSPGLVATVRVGPPYATTAEQRRLYAQVRHRHSHCGGFRPGGLPIGLLQTLRELAYLEHVSLRIVADPRARIALAALTEAADQVQRQNPEYAAEAARWAAATESPPSDAHDEEPGPCDSVQTGRDFAGRDFARGEGWSGAGAEQGVATGVAAMLVTDDDDRAAWLSAGQALQRILLRAAEHDVSATFHSQALQVSELREFIRTRFCDGAYPQMIMRLGVALPSPARKSVTELTRGRL